MTFQSLIQDVGILGLALQLFLAVTLVVKRAWVRFPVFVAYSLLNLLETAILYPLNKHRLAYFYIYSVTETIAIVLGLAVAYEIFNYLFTLYPGLRRVARLNFYGAFILLLLLAAAVLYDHAPIGRNGVVLAVFLVEEAARILEVGLVTILFVFSSLFGLHWRQPVFGIALGLGIYTVARLLILTVVPHVGPAGNQAVNLANALSFDCAMLIWLGYTLAPERATGVAELPKRAQLEQWNQAIMELINQ